MQFNLCILEKYHSVILFDATVTATNSGTKIYVLC